MTKLIFALLLVALCIGVPSALVAMPDQTATALSVNTVAPAVVFDASFALPVIEGVRLGAESASATVESQAPPESALGILLMLAVVTLAAFAGKSLENYFKRHPDRVKAKPWQGLMNAAVVGNASMRC